MVTSIPPIVSNGGRYTIDETCKILCIHRTTLRRYTESGLIKCGDRRESGRKFYLGSEIMRFWKAQL